MVNAENHADNRHRVAHRSSKHFRRTGKWANSHSGPGDVRSNPPLFILRLNTFLQLVFVLFIVNSRFNMSGKTEQFHKEFTCARYFSYQLGYATYSHSFIVELSISIEYLKTILSAMFGISLSAIRYVPVLQLS